MDIVEKLNILNLSEKEEKRMKTKGIIPLSLSTKQEIADIVGYLRIYDIKVNFSSRVIICLSKEEIVNKIKLMSELGEIDLYKEDPNRLCRDANDLKMKIEYARDNGVIYKENGKYKKFLFNEKLWKKEFAKEDLEPIVKQEIENSPIMEFAPVEENDIHHINIETNIPEIEEQTHININNNVDNDMEDLNKKIISFQDMKSELEKELASLDSLKETNNQNNNIVDFNEYVNNQNNNEEVSFENFNNSNDNMVSFMDYNNEEEMGMRRAA